MKDMTEELEPHDSAYVYSSQKKHHWYEVGQKIALSERDTSKRNYILAFLIVLTVLGGIFGLGYVFQYLLSPPTQVVGICSPPAFIATDNNCYQIVTVTNTSGQVSYKTVQTGTLVGSAESCSYSQCVPVG